MTYRTLLLSTVVGLALSGPVFADDTKKQSNPAQQSATDRTLSSQSTVQAKKLLGADIKNAQNETIGEVESINVDKDGKVRSVIVGVGGFLGMGERNVSVNWEALTVTNDGDTVRTNLTKDQLKAMPEYKYSDNSFRGKMFNDTGIYRN